MTWREVPDGEKERLRAREAAQRSETRRRGMKVEPVSVEALWMLQRGLCGCPERCAPLNPFAKAYADDQTVIGHIDGRHFTECHTIDSVRLQLASCNRKDAGREATERASRAKAEAVRGLKPTRDEKPRKAAGGSRIKSRGFQEKPEGYVSPLSKASRNYRKKEWK
jgi:hypothetical protein